MSNLQYRQDKIKAKRMKTEFRDFVMEIASWMPMTIYKRWKIITPYSEKINVFLDVLSQSEFEEYRYILQEIEYDWDFMNSIINWFKKVKIWWQKFIWQNNNSEFNYIVLWSNNSYLSIVVVDSENIFYCYNIFWSKYIYNSILIQNSNNIYQSRCVNSSSNIYYSSNISDSSNIYLCSNLVWCNFCINCNWLQNQKYHINNQQKTKEEYDIYMKEINNFTFYEKNTDNTKIKWSNIWNNIIWQFNRLCDNIIDWYMNYQIKNGKNIILWNATDLLEDCIDCCSIWWTKSDNIYACMWVWYWCSNVYWSIECSPFCNNVYYGYLLESCSFCLGCIWLKNKSYCILNKQYTKEEWYEKVDEIFWQMDANGTLGEFFPASMNPFYFNDTAAYLIDPSFTREEVIAKWYLRRDEPIRVDIPEGALTVKSTDLDKFESFDNQWNRVINSDILKYIIQDEFWNIYRIVKMEYDFLVKYGLPLPRKHWLDRMKENFRINH